MDKLKSYIELGKTKGLRPSQIDPPVAKLIRFFYHDLPPLMTLPTTPLALIFGIYWGALFYPGFFLLKNFDSEASTPFNWNLYLATILMGPLLFGYPTVFFAKRKLTKHGMPDWKSF